MRNIQARGGNVAGIKNDANIISTLNIMTHNSITFNTLNSFRVEINHS